MLKMHLTVLLIIDHASARLALYVIDKFKVHLKPVTVAMLAKCLKLLSWHDHAAAR